MSHLGESQSSFIGVFIRREDDTHINPKATTCGHRGKATIYKSRREASEEISPADTLILDSGPPRLQENRFLVCKLPSLWYFVTAAWADQYMGQSIWNNFWLRMWEQCSHTVTWTVQLTVVLSGEECVSSTANFSALDVIVLKRNSFC